MTRSRINLALAFILAAAGLQAHAQSIPTLPSFTNPPPMPATPPDLAFGAFQRGYYVTALREAMKRIGANAQDAAAMTLVGELYKDGLGVRRDPAEADKWYRLASNLGDREASFALGTAYLQGSGVGKDPAAAKALFEKAATKGHSGALYNLGVMALENEAQDFSAAANFFRKAADGGNTDGALALALLYRAGKGVPEDPKTAADWLKRAADERNTGAEVEYGIALFNGIGVDKDEAAAARYFMKAAVANNAVAQNRIARLLASGRGIRKNMVEAMKWHLLASGAGVKDEWLDQQLATLSPKDRTSVEDALRKYVGQ